MMTEKELIAKLQELRQIRPNRDWAVFAKGQILGQEERYQNQVSAVLSIFRIILARPAYAAVTAIFLFTGLFGTFTFAQNSLPGDTLYSIKKISEKAQVTFATEEELPRIQLEMANKRIEELTRVAKENRVKNLSPAISETRASISEANKNLAKVSNPEEVKKFVNEIEEKAQVISQTLGVAFAEEEREELRQSSDKLYFSDLISTLETSTLTEAQEEILIGMKKLAEEGEYSQALILFHAEFNRQADIEPEEDTEEETN